MKSFASWKTGVTRNARHEPIRESRMLRIVRELMEYKELLKNLIYQDLQVRYRNSVLGLIWTLLHPLLSLLVLYAVFSRIARFPGMRNYAMFLFAGIVPWTFFSQLANQSLNAVLSKRRLIGKIYLPKIIFPISLTLSNSINFGFFLLTYLVICAFTNIGLQKSIVFLPIPILMLMSFSLGVSFLLSSLNIFFRDFTHLTGILLQILFYVSPILYPISITGKYKPLFMLNPLYFIIVNFRAAIYDGKPPDAIELWGGLAICIGTLLFGLWVFGKLERKFIYYV